MAFVCSRRAFLKDSVTLVMAAPGLSKGHALTRPIEDREGSLLEELERGFQAPPDAAWPWVYWFASDGNLTREGITADLEAMHRIGIRGVLYMEVDQYVPKGPARFLTPPWRELIQHAVKEATRLGITVDMNNDGGWCGSAGPWITPDLSMQVMVWSETNLQGPGPFTGVLPQPKTVRDHYRDITVLAFPTPPAESVRMVDCSPRLTYGPGQSVFDSEKLLDGNPGTVALLPLPQESQPQYLNIEFPEPYTAQALTIALDVWNSEIEGALEVSDDGRNYRTIRPLTVRWPMSSVNFEKVTARYYRVLLRPQSDWFFQQFAKGIPLGEVELHPSLRIEDIPGKAAYIRQDMFSGEGTLSAEMVVRKDHIMDLSTKMDREGHLIWDVPTGKWTVLRIGHTSTGKMNHPAPEESLGLECDKLSKKAVEVQFAGLMSKLLEDQAAVGAKALTMTHIDSWETGSQNWTPGFREEFQRRRGYDLFPYLPTLTGRTVESREVSERFLWDLRRTIADMLLENYAGHMRSISHQHGLALSIEAYGGGPLEEVAYGGRADMPMSEFWTGELPNVWNKEMASAAHVYGRPILGAESFTADPAKGKWQNHPFQLKPLGDHAFTLGINRFIFHRYSMQPWVDRKPGMTMGPWGIHYERTNTWWEQSKAWLQYLARCQYVLQKGQFVADVAYLGSENAPSSFPDRASLNPAIPFGYDYDYLPPEVLLDQATVRDGRLVLPSGMSYRILVLPGGQTMTPALLNKITNLVEAGATVVGPQPIRSPSLTDYPRCDREVKRLAADLWGECGVGVTENRFGKGKIVWGTPLAEVLGKLDVRPDFACHGVTAGEQIRYIHRNIDGDDFYFVASGNTEAKRFLCTFRIKGKRPELWWPDTGRRQMTAVYEERDGGVQVPIPLDPYGSVFVVFRAGAPSSASRVVSLRRNDVEVSGVAPTPGPETQLQRQFGALDVDGGNYRLEVGEAGAYELKTAAGRTLKVEVATLPSPIELDGLWVLEFPKGEGAPDRVALERLISWTDHPNPGVKYFSGTATYRRQFTMPAGVLGQDRRLYLDLGRVLVIAQATLNGHDLGILWKPPFCADITDTVRAGTNDLAVSVVNLWPNRLIGDDHLPEDSEWVPQHWGAVVRRYPKWLLENKPSPTGRLTFATWKHWNKNDPLLESGLLGPVRVIPRARISIK